MSQTPNLNLPYILASQAQKHVVHNEALRSLDAIVQLSVAERNVEEAPGDPAEGQRFLVDAEPQGEWAGRGNQVASWADNGWHFKVANAGWIAWVVSENQALVFDGADWISFSDLLLNPAQWVGINTTADTQNRLAVKSAGVLLTHDDLGEATGDIRLSLNKASATDTASIMMQSAYATVLEAGIVGADEFRMQIFPGATDPVEAFGLNLATGRVELAQHPKFSGYVNYDHYVGADNWAAISINNARHNDQLAFSAGDGRFTAPHDGYFHFSAGYVLKANNDLPSEIRIGLGIDGAQPTEDAQSRLAGTLTSLGSQIQTSGFLKLETGQSVRAYAYMAGNDGYVCGNANHFWGYQIP